VRDELVNRSIELPSGELRLLQPQESAELPDAGDVEWAPIAPYWSVLWRSGVALARELDGVALRGLRVVELGCGLAVPSIAAARAGATVLATDTSADALTLVARNAHANDVRIETARVAWAEPDRLVRQAPFDLALAADVFYERAAVGHFRFARKAAVVRGRGLSRYGRLPRIGDAGAMLVQTLGVRRPDEAQRRPTRWATTRACGGRSGARARQKSSSSARFGPARTRGVPVSRSKTLWPALRITLPAPGRCMMLIAPFSVTVPRTKSYFATKWLCSCSVKPVTLLTSFERWTMWSIALIGCPAASSHTWPRTLKKSTKSSLKVHAGLNVEQSIVSDSSNANV
jgi:SAM-dependent methyltransferase